MSKTQVGVVVAILAMIALLVFVLQAGKVDLVKQYDLTGQEMTITITFANTQEIREKFEEINGYESDVRAFATLYPETNECVVFTRPVEHQTNIARMELLGHEVLHCLYGQWHPESNPQ